MNYENILKTFGINFKILRSDVVVSELSGIFHTEEKTGKKYVGFLPNSDVKIGDCLINPSEEKFYVTDTQTFYFKQNPCYLSAYYKTEAEHNSSENSSNTVFNIGAVSNSVIGNNNVATMNCQQLLSDIKNQASSIEENKEEIQEIISLLRMIVENKIPVQKGLFSRFADVLAKHSWLTSSITNVILTYLMNSVQ